MARSRSGPLPDRDETGTSTAVTRATPSAFGALLQAAGALFAVASRTSRSFRRQLGADVVVEIRSDDGVARHFLFRNRRARSRSGRAARADCTLCFATARQGFEILTARDGARRLLDGMTDGSVRLEGRTALFGWFQGLGRSVVPGAPPRRLPATPPGVYLAPRSSPAVSRFITREAPERVLDPAWTAALVAREKLLLSRAAAGEPLPPF